MIPDINRVLQRQLTQLRQEVEQYPDDESLWRTAGQITNPAGTLCLHLCGNLQHFIGAVLGHSGYQRNRDEEFGRKNVPRQELLRLIDRTAAAVHDTLENLPEEALGTTYPIEVFGEPMTTGYFLVHLTTHLGYHLGQINYHRRLLTGA